MERAISIFTQLPHTKGKIDLFANQIIKEATSGDYSALELLRQFKAAEAILKVILSDKSFKDECMTEACLYDEKTIKDKDCVFEVKNAPAKYDYSKCNYSKYDQAEKSLSLAKEELKGIQNFLKGLKTPFQDEFTGEEVYPPSKSQETIVAVKLK